MVHGHSVHVLVRRAPLLCMLLVLLVLTPWRVLATLRSSQVMTITPHDSISDALKRAQPGDTVLLSDGVYTQDVITDHDGRVDAPFTLKGTRNAVIAGSGDSRIIQVSHENTTLDGFAVDGTAGGKHGDKGVYVIGQRPGSPLRGIRLVNLAVRNIGGECVRLRYLVQGAEVAHNEIGPCGLVDFPGGHWGGDGKNGEGIYVGTAPEQRGANGAPDSSPDHSNGNWIHDNRINTQGNECVDIKEDATGNLVEHVTCTGQRDPDSAGFDSRGNGTIFRFNTVTGSTGAGFRFGGDTASDGIGNYAYGNTLSSNAAGGFKLMRLPQAAICGNTGQLSVVGTSSVDAGRSCDPAELPAISGPQLIGAHPSPTSTPSHTPTPSITPTPPSSTPEPTTPPEPTPTSDQLSPSHPLVIPADHGQIESSIMQVRQSGNRTYLTSTSHGMDHDAPLGARYHINVATSGEYTVWVRGRGHDSDANSVWISAADGTKTAVHFDDDSDDWQWVRVSERFTLARGQTELDLFVRERGTDISSILITADPDAEP